MGKTAKSYTAPFPAITAVEDPPESGGESTLESAPAVGLIITPAVAGMDDLLDPDAKTGTHFRGPVMSGNPATDGIPGSAILAKRAKFTFQSGNFSIPITFPSSTILLQNILQIQQSFNSVTSAHLNLGTALNGVDIISMDLTVAPTQLTNNMATIMGSNWTIYLSLAIVGATTAGKGTLIITYSVPSKAVWS